MELPETVRRKMIGITGGIGSGKSRVAGFLHDISGAALIDADAVCRTLLEPGAAGWLAIKKRWGDEFCAPNGLLDRPLLRKRIFADPEFRHALDSVLHPLIREEIGKKARTIDRTGDGAGLLVEVPLLFEARWENDFSRIVVVYADAEQCVARLVRRDGVTLEEARNALAAQWPLAEKTARADHVIDNSGSWAETRTQLKQLAKRLWPEKERPGLSVPRKNA